MVRFNVYLIRYCRILWNHAIKLRYNFKGCAKLIKKYLPRIFFVFCVGFFALCFINSVFFPKELAEYENRKANTIMPFSFESYLNGDFQESMDSGLADQMLYAEDGKTVYNNITSRYLMSAVDLVFSGTGYFDSKYINFMDINTFGKNYLVYSVRNLDDEKELLDKRIDNINRAAEKNPDVDFYIYYVGKDTDINFETGEKSGVYEYISENLNIPSERKGEFRIDSFEEFSKYFYRTDHHWNYEGSYKGYCETAKLLGAGEDLIKPLELVRAAEGFSGSKSSTSGAETVFNEDFFAYTFEYPEMKITVNGIESQDYGNQDEYIAGNAEEKISYSNFYGGDEGEIIFDTGNTEEENILIIGESYDNAILKLLAAKFNKTYSIDLRYYDYYMGKDFELSKYIEDNDIDKVLLIGSIDYFESDDFMLEV